MQAYFHISCKLAHVYYIFHFKESVFYCKPIQQFTVITVSWNNWFQRRSISENINLYTKRRIIRCVNYTIWKFIELPATFIVSSFVPTSQLYATLWTTRPILSLGRLELNRELTKLHTTVTYLRSSIHNSMGLQIYYTRESLR